MFNPLSNEEADSEVRGATKPLKEENIIKPECSGLSQRFSEKFEPVSLNLRGGSCSNMREHLHFRGPDRLNLEMNIYEPGYHNVVTSGVWKVFQKLRRLRGSKDIILEDIFAPLDPRGTGKLSSNVFIAALMGNIGYHARLTRQDINQLAHFYADKDTNNVDYRSFIDFIQQPEPKRYELPEVETDTTLAPRRHSTTADLSELDTLSSVLDYVASVLIYKRIHIHAYLREEQSEVKSKNVTIPQLKKVFINMGIFLNDADFSLICKWFGRNAFQINTSLLLTHIDGAINRVNTSGKYDPIEISKQIGKLFNNTSFPKILHPDMRACDMREFFQNNDTAHNSQERWMTMSEDITDLVTRLQKALHVHQIIARPRFSQFDDLNTGLITIAQFKRALDQCGINTWGSKTRVFISPPEIENLIELYSESYQPGFVMWRAFVNDIESGVCIRDLHRHPSANISDHQPHGPRKEVIDLPCKYSRRKFMTMEEHRRAERVIEYVKHQLHDCDLYQFFRAFDKGIRGHVTRNQFREVMRMSNVSLRAQDVYDLELYFIDYHGFCYMFFLQVLGSSVPPPPDTVPIKFVSNLQKERSKATGYYAPYEAEGRTGQDVLNKIKNTVFERGLRLKYWFQPFDKFNSGVMDEDTFVRALTAAHNWIFTVSEFKKLIDMFRRPLSPKTIEYQHFLDNINEMYTQPDLERSPLLNPVPYQGRKERAQRFNNSEWNELGKAIHKIVKQGICLDYLQEFKDMDTNNCSTIPHSKYMRAMETLGVLKYLSEREQTLIFNAFTRPVYHRNEFDYTQFLKACHHVCHPDFVQDIN